MAHTKEIPETREIQSINLIDRLAIIDGEVFPITQMFDRFEDETEDPDEAYVVVTGADGFGWYVIFVEDFGDGATLH